MSQTCRVVPPEVLNCVAVALGRGMIQVLVRSPSFAFSTATIIDTECFGIEVGGHVVEMKTTSPVPGKL